MSSSSIKYRGSCRRQCSCRRLRWFDGRLLVPRKLGVCSQRVQSVCPSVVITGVQSTSITGVLTSSGISFISVTQRRETSSPWKLHGTFRRCAATLGCHTDLSQSCEHVQRVSSVAFLLQHSSVACRHTQRRSVLFLAFGLYLSYRQPSGFFV